MRGDDRRWRAALAIVVLLAAGCGDRGQDVAVDTDERQPQMLTRVGETGLDRTPFPIEPGDANAAGDDLVVISGAWPPGNRIDAALRRADGSWWELPPLPFKGFIQLATAGDRVVAGGVACADGGCDDGELAFAMLDEDLSGWSRLDAPQLDLPVTETELTTSPGPTDFAEFSIGSNTYTVDEHGQLVDWTPAPIPGVGGDAFEFACRVGDEYVSMLMVSGDLNEAARRGYVQEATGEVYVQPIGGSEAPTPVASVPPGTVTMYGYLCAGNQMVIDHDGTEAVFHTDNRTWERVPSNYGAVVGHGVGMSPISGRLAVGPDGTAYSAESGGVVRRVGPGAWEHTGSSGSVFATDAQVLAFDQKGTVTVLWPTA